MLSRSFGNVQTAVSRCGGCEYLGAMLSYVFPTTLDMCALLRCVSVLCDAIYVPANTALLQLMCSTCGHIILAPLSTKSRGGFHVYVTKTATSVRK
jgi:hypothetical protein